MFYILKTEVTVSVYIQSFYLQTGGIERSLSMDFITTTWKGEALPIKDR